MNFSSIISVAFGAAIGGILRFMISFWFRSDAGKFPYATCFINIIGSFLLGVIIAWSLKHSMPSSVKLFLATGFCGGFTTFSTFSLDWLGLMQSGQSMTGLSYILISVIGGLVFAWIGYRMI